MNEHGCVSVNLYLRERMAGQVWPVGRSWRGDICRERVMVGALEDMGLGRPRGHGSASPLPCAIGDHAIPLTDVTAEKKIPEHIS